MKTLTKTLLAAASLAGLFSAAPALADDAPAWGSLSAYVAVQSDYKFRGLSQNDQAASPEASLNWAGPYGFYAGTWLAKVNFLDQSTAAPHGTTLETDFYAGKHFDLGGTDLNVEAYYYDYPDHRGPINDSYYETIVQLSHTFDALTLTASGANSPNFFGSTGTGWWVGGTAAYAVNDWLSLSGNVGHQWVDRVMPWGGYTHYDLGATATYKALSLDVRYVDTDLSAAQCVAFTAGKKEWCSGTVVATLTYNISSFPW